jgi:hypothetical protein
MSLVQTKFCCLNFYFILPWWWLRCWKPSNRKREGPILPTNSCFGKQLFTLKKSNLKIKVKKKGVNFCSDFGSSKKHIGLCWFSFQSFEKDKCCFLKAFEKEFTLMLPYSTSWCQLWFHLLNKFYWS